MPRIPYKAVRFDAYPPTKKLIHGAKGMNKTGQVTVSSTDLAAYAIGVGDPAVFGTSSSRPWVELVWRASMVLNSVDERNDHFVKSGSYDRLDPSEKSAVSYFLGMTQCAAMADRVLGVKVAVHVDSFLRMLGVKLPNKSRPDLVGYSNPPSGVGTPGGFLFEAKGRTRGFSRKVVESAIKQLEKTPTEVLRLVSSKAVFAASLAYFEPEVRGGAEIWRSYLEDPPPPRRAASNHPGDEEYCGLIVVSQLFPVYRAMSGIGEISDQFAVTERDGLMTARLPLEGASVGVPVELYELLAQVDAPLRDRRQRERLARSVWEVVSEPAYPHRFTNLASTGERLSVLSSGLSFFMAVPTENDIA
jgi:hypothetical protein